MKKIDNILVNELGLENDLKIGPRKLVYLVVQLPFR